MSIDGIGGAGGPPKPGPAAGPSKTDGSFSIEPNATEASVNVSESGDLDRLARGEINRDEYLEARIDAAVAHVEAGLSPEHLQLLREQMREQLESDPMLARLLRRAGVAVADDET